MVLYSNRLIIIYISDHYHPNLQHVYAKSLIDLHHVLYWSLGPLIMKRPQIFYDGGLCKLYRIKNMTTVIVFQDHSSLIFFIMKIYNSFPH